MSEILSFLVLKNTDARRNAYVDLVGATRITLAPLSVITIHAKANDIEKKSPCVESRVIRRTLAELTNQTGGPS